MHTDLQKLAMLLGHEANVHKFQMTEIILICSLTVKGLIWLPITEIFLTIKHLEFKQHVS